MSRNGPSKNRRDPTFRSWRSMMQRCSNPRFPKFEYYGGRGITVCERWQTFANFLADMGERPAGTTIDRVDNDSGYSPGNCRWSTQFVQVQNSRRARVTADQVNEIRGRLEHGETQQAVADRFGISNQAVSSIFRRESWPNVP